MFNPNKNNSLYEIELISSYKEGSYVKLSKHIWVKFFQLLKITKYVNRYGNIYRSLAKTR